MRPAGLQRRHQPGSRAGAGDRRPHPHARRAALGGRHQLHAGARRDVRVMPQHLDETYALLRGGVRRMTIDPAASSRPTTSAGSTRERAGRGGRRARRRAPSSRVDRRAKRDRGRPRHAPVVARDGGRASRRARSRRARTCVDARAGAPPRCSTSRSADGGYDGGACVTASHNPPQYTGVKMVTRGRAPAVGRRRHRRGRARSRSPGRRAPPRRAAAATRACCDALRGTLPGASSTRTRSAA